MVVQHNISAMTANRYYGINNKGLASSLEKLASGYAINKAGDNAAGLAVSEKMRAQIGGLTQASKNAEDGISMVQTFEGALQETDSILQRMRTLAVQSANGSYQDDVDRDAIQLEFDQLNDELNQIADTDFNGVVMLNGGQMADGLQAHNGKFDYATKKDDVTNAVRDSLQNKLDAANKAYASAKTAYANSPFDLSAKGELSVGSTADEWNTVDNSAYDKKVADGLWTDLGLVDDNGKVDLSQGNEVAITFTLNNGTWEATNATVSLDGTTMKTMGKADLTNITATTADNAGAADDATGLGGFLVQGSASETNADDTADGCLGNAIFDAAAAKDGSTVTLVYRNATNEVMAPKNAGIDENELDVNSTGSVDIDKSKFVASIAGTTKDEDMTQAADDAFKAIENQTFTMTYDGTSGSAKVTVKWGENEIKNGTNGKLITQEIDGKTYKAWAETDNADPTKINFYAVKADGTKDDTKQIAELAIDTKAENKSGTVSAKISISQHGYKDNSGAITVTAGDDPNLASSATKYAAVKNAEKAASDAAQALKDFNALDENDDEDWSKIKEMYASSQSSSGAVVSVSDSLDNSKAKMTYTDQMSLQVGARTKDLVNFTFSYQSDDLGGLEKNLNCSAREGGLNTANLSVSTQKDANDAIDQIDKALNKVNMVRATFGAVQNRLEHKINNIDTNTENLTAAESRIRDTQMDKEMMKFTSAQILSQASQSMLAQANSLPQGVLQLLG